MRIFIPPISAAVASQWYIIDYRQVAFSLSIQTLIAAASTLTFSVDYTLVDPTDVSTAVPLASASQTTTTITLTYLANHNLLVGDSVYLFNTGTSMDGFQTVAAVSSATVVTCSAASASNTGSVLSQAINIPVGTPSALSSKTASTDATLTGPVNAIRLRVSSYTSGSVMLRALMGNEP